MIGRLLGLLILLTPSLAHATHLFGGQITWTQQPVPASSDRDVTLVIRVIGRRSADGFYGQGSTPIENGMVLTWTSTLNVTRAGGGVTNYNIRPVVTDINETEDWWEGYEVKTLRFTPADFPITVSWATCCRGTQLREANNSTPMQMRISIPLNSANGPDVLFPPRVQLPVNQLSTFSLPRTEVVSKTSVLSFSTTIESSLSQARPVGTAACGSTACGCVSSSGPDCSHALQLGANGVVQWQPQSEGLYAMQLDSTAYDVFGTAGERQKADFMLNVSSPCAVGDTGCNARPVIDLPVGPTSTIAGTGYDATVMVSDANMVGTLTLTPYANRAVTVTPLSDPSVSPVAFNVHFDSTAVDQGKTAQICFQARDGFDATSYGFPCLNILIKYIPIDCVLGSWSEWSACSATCASGTQTRTREVNVYPEHEGQLCTGSLSDTRSCDTGVVCPVDCVMSEWSAWDVCSQTCGGGQQSRTRSVATPPGGGGHACSTEVLQSRTCNTQVCPVDCSVSSWSDWSECSASCGGGTQARTRSIQTAPAGTGATCPTLSEEQACNTQGCPVDCVVGAYGDWSTCSAACGGGTQTRVRAILTPSAHGGTACPSVLSEAQSCNSQPCPVDCTVSAFGAWSPCSSTCGPGMQTRERTIVSAEANGGATCPALSETQACDAGPCPQACVMGDWSDWSACSATCGGGTHSRTRSVVSQPVAGGSACSTELEQTEACNTEVCPVDCSVGAWSDWSECSVGCGGGEQVRTRIVLTSPVGAGAACPALSESVACNTQACLGACEVSEWSEWSACSTTQGDGVQRRSRGVVMDNGDACPALAETRVCENEIPPAPSPQQPSGCSSVGGGAWLISFAALLPRALRRRRRASDKIG